jgi:hypothetical protein
MNEVFRDDAVQSYQILSKKEFEDLKVTFHAEDWPKAKDQLHREYTKSSFEETTLPLFQMAAHEKLQTLSGQ